MFEYIKGKTLKSFLKTRKDNKIEEWEAKKILKSITNAIVYLHEKQITHRDIKLDNIMVDSNLESKLIDFGFSVCSSSNQKLKLFCGTPSYMSPEIAARKEYYGPPTDIWSLGVLLYTMICGYFPFKGFTESELYRKIIAGGLNIPNSVSENAKLLIRRMLSSDPLKRPSASEVFHKIGVKR